MSNRRIDRYGAVSRPRGPAAEPSDKTALRQASAALAALAQETRLAVFRLLIGVGPAGLPAGAVARELGVAPATLSHHLAELEHAGLVRRWRIERQILYAVDLVGTRHLLAYLIEDCCAGRLEICGELAKFAGERAC